MPSANLEAVLNREESLTAQIQTDSQPLFAELNTEKPLKGNINVSNSVLVKDYEKLKNLPQINGVTLIGNQTSEDLLIETDKNFVFDQNEALDTWVIVHNLNKYPAVSVIDSSGSEVIGEVSYDNINQVTITFKGAFKGKATLN